MVDVPGLVVFIAQEDAGAGVVVDRKSGRQVEVRILKGVRLSHVVRIRWEFPACESQTKLRVHVGEGGRGVVVDELGSVESGKWKVKSNEWFHSTEIFLEEGAEVEFVSINAMSSDVSLTMNQRSHLKDNATIRWRNVTLGAGEVNQDLRSELSGADAVSEVDWMFYAKDDEKYRLSARNIFNGRHGGGEINMKGVAEGKGHVRCNGMIEIGFGGGQTDTYLTQNVLMLDKTAKVDAVPGLEIKTNDVKASHSATVSRVMEEDLFYFAARGIMEKEAKKMFVEGFLGEMIAKIGDEVLRDEITASVEGKYETLKRYN